MRTSVLAPHLLRNCHVILLFLYRSDVDVTDVCVEQAIRPPSSIAKHRVEIPPPPAGAQAVLMSILKTCKAPSTSFRITQILRNPSPRSPARVLNRCVGAILHVCRTFHCCGLTEFKTRHTMISSAMGSSHNSR